MDTTFTRVMGYTEINIGSSATIKWGNQRLRVALALDTTGSMASAGKIDALKTATKNLLDQLKAAATNNGDVYVSIIPFSKDVNVGTSNHSAAWLQWDDGTDKSWDGANGTCSKSGGYSPRSACTAQGSCSLSSYTSQSTCTSAGTCSLSSYTSQNSCTSAGRCSNPGQTNETSCTTQNACTDSDYTRRRRCHGQWRHLGAWDLDPGQLDGRHLDVPTWTPKSHSSVGTAA